MIALLYADRKGIGADDRLVYLAHAQWAPDSYHARGKAARVSRASDRYRHRRAVQARVPRHLAEQQDPGDGRPGRPRRQAVRARRVGRDAVLPRLQDRQIPAQGSAQPLAGAPVDDAPDWARRADARTSASLPRLRARADRVRDEPLQER